MRPYIKLLVLLMPMAVLIVMFQQCSGVNFKNANEQNQWSHECAKDASKCQEVIETFNAGSSNKNIDFTWIVDTSGSMSEEIQKTRDNLNVFVQTLTTYSNLKMALIGEKTGTMGIQLPSVAGVTTKQVEIKVESSDALIFAGGALCPTTSDATSWCSTFFNANPHKDYLGNTINSINWTRYSNAKGTLNTFLRDQSHKVFVIVSDDDASKINPHPSRNIDFLNAYQSRFPGSSPIVYSIVGKVEPNQAPSGCALYGKGKEYMALSDQTGGKAFDICANDWKPYFDEMLDGISILANTSFPLASQHVVDILYVKINGTTLNPGDYTYANRVLKIREDIMSGYTNYNIEVKILEYIP